MEPVVTNRLAILDGIEGYSFSELTLKWRYPETDRDTGVVDRDSERAKAEERNKECAKGERRYSSKEEKPNSSANYQ
tara:strand:+ start:18790 stop:19020 length:231 start_codon:yes stop_codon:yes gene_type:complete